MGKAGSVVLASMGSQEDARRWAWVITAVSGFAAAVLAALVAMVLGRESWVLPLAIAGLAVPALCLPWMTYQACSSARKLRETKAAVESISKQDMTTGMLNRHGFMEKASQAFDAARAAGRQLSVIVIDVDHLKEINQNHGFSCGDGVLAAVAEVLQLNIQSGVDLAARYGGAEFVMMMPEADYAWSLSFAERLRGTLANRPVKHDGQLVAISASLGVASILMSDATLDDLIARAGKALQAAKNGGRNKVEVAEDQLLALAA